MKTHLSLCTWGHITTFDCSQIQVDAQIWLQGQFWQNSISIAHLSNWSIAFLISLISRFWTLDWFLISLIYGFFSSISILLLLSIPSIHSIIFQTDTIFFPNFSHIDSFLIFDLSLFWTRLLPNISDLSILFIYFDSFPFINSFNLIFWSEFFYIG